MLSLELLRIEKSQIVVVVVVVIQAEEKENNFRKVKKILRADVRLCIKTN